MYDAADNSDKLHGNKEKRCRVGDRHLAFDGMPEIQACWDATRASAVKGSDAAISARTAEECRRSVGQKITEEEEKLHGGLANAAKERGTNAW